jgi:hypothetical protein
MRPGCLGCSTLVLLVLILVFGGAGLVFLSANMFAIPDVAAKPRQFARTDGHAAQQKIFELMQRDGGRSTRRDPIALSEPEASALVSGHIREALGVHLNYLWVSFRQDRFDLVGQTSVQELLRTPPFPQILPYLPVRHIQEPVWVAVKGRIQVEAGADRRSKGRGRVELTELTLGKQPVGPWLLYAMLGPPAMKLRRWEVPGVIQEIQIDNGRLVIRTR